MLAAIIFTAGCLGMIFGWEGHNQHNRDIKRIERFLNSVPVNREGVACFGSDQYCRRHGYLSPEQRKKLEERH